MDLKSRNKFSKASIIMLAFYLFICYAENTITDIFVLFTGSERQWHPKSMRRRYGIPFRYVTRCGFGCFLF